MNKFDKTTAVQIQQSLGPLNMLIVEECPETGCFRNLSNAVLRGL